MTDIVPFPLSTPPEDCERWHEMLKIAPLVIILLYMRTRDPQPVTQVELAENFLIDRKTAAGYMRRLAARDLIAKIDHNNGYVLTDGANGLLAGWGKTGHLSLKESLRLKDLKTHEKKEGRKEMSVFWTSAKELSVSQILEQTPLLFQGRSVMAFGLDQCDPLTVLAVLAHAYDQQERLSSPVVFAYRRLQRNQPPDKKYLKDPEPYLPNPFLAALGLQELAIVDVAEEDVPGEDELAEESVVDGFGRHTYWLAIIRDERFHAITNVKNSGMAVNGMEPANWDGHQLQVSITNPKKRERLQTQMTSLASLILSEYLGMPAQVAFVAVETEE